MSADLLVVEDLRAGYGAGVVLDDLGFRMGPGEALAVLGRNGVGKSTLLRCLMGQVRLHGGSIRLAGAEIARVPAHGRVRAGLGFVPQEREIFRSLTVDEHLTFAARPGPWSRETVYGLFPRLRERRRNTGTQLSGGEQQMLAIARALTLNPALLLLDEPLEGLAPIVVREVGDCIGRLVAETGQALILVEQHVRFALRLTTNALVLDRGRAVHHGPSADLLADRPLLDRLVGLRRGGPETIPSETSSCSTTIATTA